MKKRPFHDPDRPDGGAMVASAQTLEDLELVQAEVAAIRVSQANIVGALARIRGRGDGEAAVGMPVEQHLRWTTNWHGAVVTGLGNLVDVIDDLPVVRAALNAGEVCLDQAIAVARPAARIRPDLRRSLDLALDEEESWTRWAPQSIDANVARLIDELDPRKAERRERTAARRQFLHLQPELDGQALKFWGRYEGLDAARLQTILNAASDDPRSGVPRGPQLAAGLLRILDSWASGLSRHADGEAKPNVVLHVLVEEDHQSRGVAAELISDTRGFAPRLTANTLAELTDDNPNVTTITSYTRDGIPVSIQGRRGHAIDDPDNLSWDSTQELVRRRDGRCRMPGCHNPIGDVHHLTHRESGGSDHHSNLAGLCRRCHHRVLHRHGWYGLVDHNGVLILRRVGRTITSLPRHRRVLSAPKHGPPDDDLPF